MNDQPDGRPGGPALKDTGKNLYFIGFAALGGMTGFTGFTAIQVDLQVFLAERHSGRTAVDNTAYGEAMTFTKPRYGKEFSKAVS
jgi:hypothetical protein